ncbi:hypothetical protein ACFZ95_31845, partial [Pseudomonas aeruginosa]|uniref:hypothetical protein n=2 Tax=Pseudomonas aeruginosa TaxID=287 RepID=UPI003713BF32
ASRNNPLISLRCRDSGIDSQQRNQRIRPPGGPTVDNDNETILAVIVIVLFVLGIFRVVGDMQELYRQTELKGQELSRWSKQ